MPIESRRRFFGRRSVRARIALACAGLFLVTGSAFVAATYALVDRNLTSTVVTGQAATNQTGTDQSPDNTLLLKVCQKEELGGQLTPAQLAQCKDAFAGGAQAGAANQRDRDLHQQVLWSVIGLVVGTGVAGALGWLIGGRILSPLHKVTNAARRASQEHLDERIEHDGPNDELKQLAD